MAYYTTIPGARFLPNTFGTDISHWLLNAYYDAERKGAEKFEAYIRACNHYGILTKSFISVSPSKLFTTHKFLLDTAREVLETGVLYEKQQPVYEVLNAYHHLPVRWNATLTVLRRNKHLLSELFPQVPNAFCQGLFHQYTGETVETLAGKERWERVAFRDAMFLLARAEITEQKTTGKPREYLEGLSRGDLPYDNLAKQVVNHLNDWLHNITDELPDSWYQTVFEGTSWDGFVTQFGKPAPLPAAKKLRLW